MNCTECGLEKLEGHVHYCLEALKAEVARLHTVCSNQFERYRKGAEEWAKTADEEREKKEAALLQFSELRTAALNILHEIAADSDGGQNRYEGYGPLFDAVWKTSQKMVEPVQNDHCTQCCENGGNHAKGCPNEPRCAARLGGGSICGNELPCAWHPKSEGW